MPEPIQITLYGEDDEPIKTYTRSIIPWGLLKKAAKLSSLIGENAEDAGVEAAVSEVSAFVVEIFGNQFTVEELEQGADVGEIVAVLQAIVARASGLVKANPTLPRPLALK